MKWLMIFILATLMGCQTVPEAHVQIPAALLQECGPLNKLEGTTGKELIQNIVANAALYHSCADGKKALIQAVSKDTPKP